MKKHKKLILGILAFIIPFTILTIIFNIKHFFSDNSIVIGDAFAQYYPLYNYLKGVFDGTNTLFFTLHKNFGGTMYGTFFYYLSSPLNILVKFISKNDIQLFMTWLIIIKMSLCSLTMYLFITYKNKTSNILILTFSICYGLMGYNINFFVNNMWLDVVIMTPIVIMGLDKLINKGSQKLYIISLFISVLSNYYIAYMLCIFCVIYLIYELKISNKEKQEKIEIIKHFIISSLLSGLMCSFFLIPCLAESRTYARNLNVNQILKFDYNIFDIFSKTYVGSIDLGDILNYTSMNLYCGVIVFPLVYLYLINKDIPKKERRTTLLVILFMILPCFIFPLNYVWHLFSKPNYYSYRFSFLLCFFIINIAYKSYKNININKLKSLFYLAVYSIISFYFILITSFGNYYDFLNYKMIWLTLGFVFIYFIVLKIKNKKINLTLISSLLLIEIIINISITFDGTYRFKSDYFNNEDYIKIVEKYKDERMDFTKPFTENDSLLMNYYGVNNFISTNNSRVMRFITQVGLKKKYTIQNLYSYEKGQYIMDSIIGLKHVISTYKIQNYKLIEQVNINDIESYVYENPNYIGFGYIIKNECNNIEHDFKFDETIFNCMTNFDSKYYKEYDIEKIDDEYESIIKKPTDFYIVYPGIAKREFDIEEELTSYGKDYIFIENTEKNYNLKFKTDGEIEEDKLKIYYFDFEKFKSKVKEMYKEILDYKIVDNKIEGNIKTNGGILMLTIPYEKGYNIEVDGKKVKYKEVLDTFIGIDLDKGTHEIKVEYKQPYLKLGIILSLISLISTIFYISYFTKKEI